MFQRLAQLDDIPTGRTKYLVIETTPLILANWSGTIYALEGLCPHQKNPLEGATLWDNLLDCPFHHFQYDVRTGENYYPKNVYPRDYPRLQEQLNPLKTYPVQVRDGAVWVDIE